ncbi:chemokine-like protein TAFA-5 isoform X3 [Syngnathus typhle]|uniref:chemokine-like protein TAFA-5 isoform X3 n=1 Tax=Syngnathus typhle TaxID=161592 RepID=UPI002A6B4022|nr:chemokine-like protein TAFA-5 isoform X3 [Syngnathus typhle]
MEQISRKWSFLQEGLKWRKGRKRMNNPKGHFTFTMVSCASCAGELRTGSCEVLTLERDGSHPRRSVARQTARCACVPGQMAGTTQGRPACVHAGIVLSRQWCEMSPCLDDEGCRALVDGSGWSCAQPGGRVKTTTVS